MPDLSTFCPDCGRERGHYSECPQSSKARLSGHRIDCKLALGGKFCTCDYHKRMNKEKEYKKLKEMPPPKKLLEIKQKMDGTTWMVSVIGPKQNDGSTYWMERAGKDPITAVKGYMKEADDDNTGAQVIREFPDEVIICVVDQTLAPSGKQWKVHLFCVENGKPVRFPGG